MAGFACNSFQKFCAIKIKRKSRKRNPTPINKFCATEIQKNFAQQKNTQIPMKAKPVQVDTPADAHHALLSGKTITVPAVWLSHLAESTHAKDQKWLVRITPHDSSSNDAEIVAVEDLPPTQKRVTVQMPYRIEDSYQRRRHAEILTHIVSLTDVTEHMPYNPQPGDDYRWSIDQYGNDFWVHFDRQDTTKFELTCRYDTQIETLISAAMYTAVRLGGRVVDQ